MNLPDQSACLKGLPDFDKDMVQKVRHSGTKNPEPLSTGYEGNSRYRSSSTSKSKVLKIPVAS